MPRKKSEPKAAQQLPSLLAPHMGHEIRELLEKAGIETPLRVNVTAGGWKIGAIREHVMKILGALDLDLQDDSLKDTPMRVAKMFVEEIFWGLDYSNFPKMTLIENKMKYDELLVTKCSVKSFCEHHLVPFTGVAHVAYIPQTKVLGLSKFNRVVDFFSRRPQVQERLTAQIHATLCHVLKTQDVAVVIKAEHMCVKLRGIQDQCSETTTSKLSGKFRDHPVVRGEFLMLTKG